MFDKQYPQYPWKEIEVSVNSHYLQRFFIKNALKLGTGSMF